MGDGSMMEKVVVAFIESKGHKITFAMDGEKSRIYNMKFKLEPCGLVEFDIIFNKKNDTDVQIRSYCYVLYQKEKIEKVYKICSDMNKKFVIAKFYPDEEANEIVLSDDAFIQLDTCGEEVYKMLVNIYSIAEEAYPEIMHELYG